MTDPFFRPLSAASLAGATSFDAGLRGHMQRVFGYMGGGLGITGLVALIVANTPLAGIIFGSPLKWVAMLAPLGFIMFMNFRMNSMSAATLRTMFLAFCATMGVSMAAIFLVFTGESIARTFFICAGMFGAMSLWGYTTKRDLTGLGAFMMMGMVGLFLALVVNMFLASPGVQWVTSIIGVLIFTGLTAWQTQSIKQSYAEEWGQEANEKLAVGGALQLYLSFINMFQFLLSLTGSNRN